MNRFISELSGVDKKQPLWYNIWYKAKRLEDEMENYKKKAIELIMGLAVEEKKSPSVIPYAPAKLYVSENEKKTLPRKLGGRGRVYSNVLSDMLCSLEAERRANIHSIMIVKNGVVICEASHPGYDVNTFHLSHSMSKTITGIAAGILIDEGKLDVKQRIVDIFPENSYSDSRFEDMTVEHLLTMRSGVSFGEAGTVTEEHWTDAFFNSRLDFSPGEAFSYNSMNSYILGRIVTKLANKDLSEFAAERIFTPLGINSYLWERGPEGEAKGGFGLYLSCESYAKIGLLLLAEGSYNDHRIVSADFIKLMTSTHSYTDTENSSWDYGYHIWTARGSGDYLINGMLGQNVIISPEHGIAVSVNSGNNELFQDSPALEIIRAHIPKLNASSKSTRADYKELKARMKNFGIRRHFIRPKEPLRTISALLHLKNPKPFDENWYPVLGTYAFTDNNTGLLPIFVSVFQNNYMGGIEKITLSRRGDDLILTSLEGGREYDIPIGIYDFRETLLELNGERYKVRAIGEAMEDEDRVPVYKIELIFPELPNTRTIKITHTPQGIKMRMSETPNQNVADKFISSFLGSGKIGFAMGLLEKKLGEDFISKKLTALFNPELYGINTDIGSWEQIIEAVNKDLSEKRDGSNKFIKSMITKFISDEKPEKQKEEKANDGGFLAKALSSIFSRFVSPPKYEGVTATKDEVGKTDEDIN